MLGSDIMIRYKKSGIVLVVIISSLLIPTLFSEASAEILPGWVRTIAKWYGEGLIPEDDFINTIKFLIDSKIITSDFINTGITNDAEPSKDNAMVIIPNGSGEQSNRGFYLPLNLDVHKGTVVTWINDDNLGHTIQSQDGKGFVIPLFNSDVLKTGEEFTHTFDESGVYPYFCTLHPWRVGTVTVS